MKFEEKYKSLSKTQKQLLRYISIYCVGQPPKHTWQTIRVLKEKGFIERKNQKRKIILNFEKPEYYQAPFDILPKLYKIYTAEDEHILKEWGVI